jgi:hypothetical protein
MAQEIKCKVSSVMIEIVKTPDFKENPIRYFNLTLEFMEPIYSENQETPIDAEFLQVKFAPITDCEEFLVYGMLYDDRKGEIFDYES